MALRAGVEEPQSGTEVVLGRDARWDIPENFANFQRTVFDGVNEDNDIVVISVKQLKEAIAKLEGTTGHIMGYQVVEELNEIWGEE